MATNGNGQSRFNKWLSSGLLATIGWIAVLTAYCTFRAFGIEDPILGNAFIALTAGWIGLMQAAMSKKRAEQQAAVEEKVDKLERVAKRQHPEVAGDLE